jgi:hypothetical protein
MGRFLEYDRGRSVATKKFYPEPHHPRVSLMDVQKDFVENKRDKDNQHGVELALLGFDCQVANRPHSTYSSGCYLSMLAISLKPGITRNPKHLLAETSLGLNI